jgi:hypothetical protein
LYTAVSTTGRRKTRGLERENLIWCKLLLIESLLLLLKGFDLILNGNLHDVEISEIGAQLLQDTDLLCHDARNFAGLNFSARFPVRLLLLLRELEPYILFTYGWIHG